MVVIKDNSEECRPTCTCNMFNSKHIPCRHLICFLTLVAGKSKLPKSLVVKWWFQNPKPTPMNFKKSEDQGIRDLNGLFDQYLKFTNIGHDEL